MDDSIDEGRARACYLTLIATREEAGKVRENLINGWKILNCMWYASSKYPRSPSLPSVKHTPPPLAVAVILKGNLLNEAVTHMQVRLTSCSYYGGAY